MEDERIIDLYFSRSERAIAETKRKYGRMLCGIALGILRNLQDAEECESDTYVRTWNAIPPTRPGVFSAFLSRIVRNLSLDRYGYLRAQKRGEGEIPLVIDELAECIPDGNDMERIEDELLLRNRVNAFLRALKPDARVIFMRRYWFGDSVQEISQKFGYTLSKVKMSLSRSRQALRAALEDGGERYE